MSEFYSQGNNPENEPDENDQNNEADHPVEYDRYSLAPITPRISPIAAAFIGLFGALMLYQIVGGIITIAIFGLDIEKAPADSLRLMTMASQLLFLLLPALLFTKWFYQDITRIFRIKLPDLAELGLFTLGFAFLTPLLQFYMMMQQSLIEKLAANNSFVSSVKSFLDNINKMLDQTYKDMLTAHNPLEWLLIILVVALIPALCEEALFRGFIQRSFEFKMKPFRAALFTAIFFGLYHFNPYSLIPLTALGFYFGFASYKSNSIVIAMFLHFLNNFTAIILYFFWGDSDLVKSTPSANVDMYTSILYFFILLFLFSGSVFLINRYYKQNIRRNYADMS